LSVHSGKKFWKDTQGSWQHEMPGKTEGIIAIVNAIKDMGALLSLDISSCNLGQLALPD
jgi:hypothetical protein